MIRSITVCAFILLALIPSSKVIAQSRSVFSIQEEGASQLINQGKIEQAKSRLIEGLTLIKEPLGKASLHRDLLQVCSMSFDWACVSKSLQDLKPLVESERGLRLIIPDLILHEAKLMEWNQNDEYMRKFSEAGGANAAASPSPHATLYSELQLSLHNYYLRNRNWGAAEHARSMAMFGLLMAKVEETSSIGKVVIELIEAQLNAGDIVGATSLFIEANHFLATSLPEASLLYARYLTIIGHLLSFTDAHSQTADAFKNAALHWQALELDQQVKMYPLATANSMATAALALDNKIEDALALHGQHPLQGQKEEIFQQHEFRTYGEFYFGVSDIFLIVASKGKVDSRWRAIFSKEPNWKLTEFEASDFKSYQKFALGLIDISEGYRDRGRSLIENAAKERIKNFDLVLRSAYESSQAPSLVDKIIISSGLAVSATSTAADRFNLMIQGSEVLTRNGRHRLVDVASHMAGQPDSKARRDAHGYLQLADKKRDWELKKLRALFSKDASSEDKGDVLVLFSDAIEKLEKIKRTLQSRKSGDFDGVPTLQALQSSLGDSEVFIGYFPFVGGFGKFCLSKDHAVHAVSVDGPSILVDAKFLVQEAAKFPTNADAAANYPFETAFRVYRFLFGGLEDCLKAGSNVTVALPPELASVPLGALVAKVPPRLAGGYELSAARWLIADYAFSIVISARHYLAARVSSRSERATRNYLGIGDPQLEGDEAEKAAFTEFARGSLSTPHGLIDFAPLPETADEIKAAGKLFFTPTADVLLGKQGTEEYFRAKPLAEYDIIHFATHGLAKGDVLGMSDGALVLTPGNVTDSFNDGLLSGAEIARLTLNARLIILSACSTAKFDVAQTTRGVQDLQAAFTVAGAPTLLASLWPVDSLSTQELVTLFLKNWRNLQTKSASASLARATREFLAQADILHRHPSYWAAFAILGNGSIQAVDDGAKRSHTIPTFDFLDGFAAGGEILHTTTVGSDLLLSVMGEWDGNKMNGILSRRSADGRELWRVASREIGIGKTILLGRSIYLEGYVTEEVPTPVLRSFDLNGRLKWTKKYPELSGHIFSDFIADQNGLVALAIPLVVPEASELQVAIVALTKDGDVAKKSFIRLRSGKSGIDNRAHIEKWNGRLIVALNDRPTLIIPTDTNRMELTCWAGLATAYYEIDPESFTVLAYRSIDKFMTTALTAVGNNLYLGGESVHECTLTGVASVVRLKSNGESNVIWKDDSHFSSSVRGLVADRGELVVGIDDKRTLGIDKGDTSKVLNYGDKRWSEGLVAKNEAALVRLSMDGKLLGRRHMAAGLNIFLSGIASAEKNIVAFGSLGGMPAHAHAPRAQSGKKKKFLKPLQEKQNNDWLVNIFGE